MVAGSGPRPRCCGNGSLAVDLIQAQIIVRARLARAAEARPGLHANCSSKPPQPLWAYPVEMMAGWPTQGNAFAGGGRGRLSGANRGVGRSGRSRRRCRSISIVSNAPACKSAAHRRRPETTGPNKNAGVMSATRICTTLGFAPFVAARMALKSRSWVMITMSCVRA